MLNVLNGIRGWFVHFRDIVYQPIMVRDNTIIVICQAIEELGNEVPLKTVSAGVLKSRIKRKAQRRGVEQFLHKMIKEHVEKKRRKK